MPIKRFLARAAARRDKSKPLRRRSHTTIASHVVIRRPVTWQRRLLLWLVLAVAAGSVGIGLFIFGQWSAGFNSLQSASRIYDLKTESARLKDMNAKLSDAYNVASTQLAIERGARGSLEKQIGKLEEERNQLSRDLALFENLFPASGQDSQPTIRSFRIEPVSSPGAPASWQYRILVMQGGQTQVEFKGMFQLQVRYRQNGQEFTARSIDNGNITEPLAFQRYRRIEGRFQPPAGAVMLGATARVMQNGRPVAESAFHP
jgi:hypothetical protein